MAEYIGQDVTVYYIHGCSGNDGNSGTANHFGSTGAWQTIQKAFDVLDAETDNTAFDGTEFHIMKTTDDSLYYRPLTTLHGEWDSHEVSFHGTNATGDVDGTIVEIHGGSAGATAIMYINEPAGNADYVVFSHLKFDGEDTSTYCVDMIRTNPSGSVIDMDYVNCQFMQATSHGVYTNNDPIYSNYINCRFNDNGGSGLNQTSSNFAMIYKCLFDNNGDDGANIGGFPRVSECIFYNNGDDGAVISGNGQVITNCVFDSNGGIGLWVTGTRQGFDINCIYSNNGGAGIHYDDEQTHTSFNQAFYNNGSTMAHPGSDDRTTSYNYVEGTIGYVDPSNFDFTPSSTTSVVKGAGMNAPYQWFGSSADDIGLNKWVKTETTSIF
jgi:hypothetical protein